MRKLAASGVPQSHSLFFIYIVQSPGHLLGMGCSLNLYIHFVSDLPGCTVFSKASCRSGKLEIDQEEVGTDPNGTEFVIATKDSPELDTSSLVIGRVIEGIEVVQKISQVKTVQENTSSPYFKVAKLIGDKRAVVAERGFNRPYSKVVVTNCGVIQ
ncbi:hypothetical protein TSUD_320850 [Trifolium subterraneum]|uniref:PPIase cyclophilin-type domain-containing protein n=1 Tax=Trifolium subterraneum TaxID=3900 RepID=A0A2Z6NQY7_TRISU|nr:hypothetical protein TSUD_320850 [Trifolium subterraneum]